MVEIENLLGIRTFKGDNWSTRGADVREGVGEGRKGRADSTDSLDAAEDGDCVVGNWRRMRGSLEIWTGRRSGRCSVVMVGVLVFMVLGLVIVG